MVVSLNPSYLCNLRCPHCYLSNEQLGDKKILDLKYIETHLNDISNYEEIEHIDVYGGEIALLKETYILELINLLENYTKSINIISNGTIIKDWMYDKRISISFSYDGSVREKNDVSFKNMSLLQRNFSILGLVSKEFDVEEFILHTNFLNNCETVELKPYSMSNNSEQIDLNYKFIESVKTLLKKSNKHIINEERIKRSLSKVYSAYSDKHVYITPTNKIASLEFINNIEYFKHYETFEDFKSIYKENICATCKECEYLGKCLTEHYRDNEDPENCSGFYYLLKWYENNYFPKFLHKSYKYYIETNKYDDIANDIGFEINEKDKYTKDIETYLYDLNPNSTLTFPLKTIVVTMLYTYFLSKDYEYSIEEILHFDIYHSTDQFYSKQSIEYRLDLYPTLINYFKLDLDKIYKNNLKEYNPHISKIVDYYIKENRS